MGYHLLDLTEARNNHKIENEYYQYKWQINA